MLSRSDPVLDVLELQNRRRDIMILALTGLTDAYRRLVHTFEAPQWHLFHICECAGMDDGMVVLDEAANKAEACDACLDVGFTQPLVEKWVQAKATGTETQVTQCYQDIRELLQDVSSNTAATSFAVERDHAQDQRITKGVHRSKGIGVAAGLTFLSRVCRSWQACRYRLQSKALTKRYMPKNTTIRTRSWTQPTSARNIFIKEALRQQPGARISADLSARWRSLTAAEREEYDNKAAQVSQERLVEETEVANETKLVQLVVGSSDAAATCGCVGLALFFFIADVTSWLRNQCQALIVHWRATFGSPIVQIGSEWFKGGHTLGQEWHGSSWFS